MFSFSTSLMIGLALLTMGQLARSGSAEEGQTVRTYYIDPNKAKRRRWLHRHLQFPPESSVAHS